MVYLLDANALIALTVQEHEHHRRVARWVATIDRLALCPVVEGALIRFLLRVGESAQSATEILRMMRASRRCEFWTDSVSYADADLSHVQGHRQVTDAYLAALVREHGSAGLATLDRALAREVPDVAHLIPSSRS